MSARERKQAYSWETGMAMDASEGRRVQNEGSAPWGVGLLEKETRQTSGLKSGRTLAVAEATAAPAPGRLLLGKRPDPHSRNDNQLTASEGSAVQNEIGEPVGALQWEEMWTWSLGSESGMPLAGTQDSKDEKQLNRAERVFFRIPVVR